MNVYGLKTTFKKKGQLDLFFWRIKPRTSSLKNFMSLKNLLAIQLPGHGCDTGRRSRNPDLKSHKALFPTEKATGPHSDSDSYFRNLSNIPQLQSWPFLISNTNGVYQGQKRFNDLVPPSCPFCSILCWYMISIYSPGWPWICSNLTAPTLHPKLREF